MTTALGLIYILIGIFLCLNKLKTEGITVLCTGVILLNLPKGTP